MLRSLFQNMAETLGMRPAFSDIQEFYKFVDDVTQRLSSSGMAEESRALHSILHETAWTTGSELVGELGMVFKKIKKQKLNELPSKLQSDIIRCLNYVRWMSRR